LHLKADEYVSGVQLLNEAIVFRNLREELALIGFLFWMGWLGFADQSLDAKVSIGQIPRSERKSLTEFILCTNTNYDFY